MPHNKFDAMIMAIAHKEFKNMPKISDITYSLWNIEKA
jgi:hypothetical protein